MRLSGSYGWVWLHLTNNCFTFPLKLFMPQSNFMISLARFSVEANKKKSYNEEEGKTKLNLWKLFLIFPSYISISYDTHKQIVKIEWKIRRWGKSWMLAVIPSFNGNNKRRLPILSCCRPMCSSSSLGDSAKSQGIKEHFVPVLKLFFREIFLQSKIKAGKFLNPEIFKNARILKQFFN